MQFHLGLKTELLKLIITMNLTTLDQLCASVVEMDDALRSINAL